MNWNLHGLLPVCTLTSFLSDCLSPLTTLLIPAILMSKKKIIRGKSWRCSIAGRKVGLLSTSLWFYSVTVGIERSDFVCRWCLLHVFKPSTQSRSTISLLPCCLTELCLVVCYCMCCAFSAPGYNSNNKFETNWKYICFYLLQEKYIKYLYIFLL